MPPKKGGRGQGSGGESGSSKEGGKGKGRGKGGPGQAQAPQHKQAAGPSAPMEEFPSLASGRAVTPSGKGVQGTSTQLPSQPQQPVVRPQQPAVQPQQPVVRPQQPAVQPQQPVVRPQQPAVQPQQPVIRPQQPAAQYPPTQTLQQGVAGLQISEASGSTSAPTRQAPPVEDFTIPFIRPSTQIGVSKSALNAIARPGYGKLGTPVTLKANHYLVKIKGSLDQLTIYHYDVSVSPSLTNKGVLRGLLRQLITDNQKDLGGTSKSPALPVYDGVKNLYSIQQLPFTEKDFRIVLPDREEASTPTGGKAAGPSEVPEKRRREFRVVIKIAQTYNGAELDLYLKARQLHVPQEVVQAMDVALQQRPMSLYTPVGRSFFTPEFGESPLGGDLVGWRGFYQSLRPTQQGLSLNLDVSSTAFHSEVPVIQYVGNSLGKKFDSRARLSDSERLKVKKALFGLKVTVTHRNTNRRYRISGVTKEPLDKLSFEVEEGGKKVSVADYFKKTYNLNLKFPGLPSLVIGQNTYLPMEVCVLVKGQRYMGKLNEMQVTAMLRSTCKKPRERQDDIQNMIHNNNYAQDSFANQFGLTVSTEMATVRGRVLPPPNLTYANNAQVKPSGGAWNLMGGHRFVEGKPIQNWAIINFGRVPPPVLNDFVAGLSRRCSEVGVAMNPITVVPPVNGRLDNVEDSLRKICASARQKIPQPQWLQLLVVVLSEKTVYYNDIKRICDTQLNVPTQCCLQKHVFKNQSQYLANLAMKINVKVGGRNVLLYDESIKRLPFVSDKPTMLIGADVTHPAPGDETAPSIAAVVASMDWPQANRYGCLLETQRHRQEIIEGLHRENRGPKGEIVPSGMIRKLLFSFFKSTGQKPDRIIVFRDGVSEGQFYQVLGFELSAIKRACMMMDTSGKYNPRITFVIVQKRHHTRLFPTDRNTDRSGNVQPGTCVDTAICHPREFDFYLNSHAGIQGTSRPTKYHVLFDENNFSPDGMQNLCNSLCYTYVRCTRAVSLVPPAYYADLAAFRASLYLHSSGSVSGSDTGSQSGYAGSTVSAAGSARVVSLPEVMDIPNKGMFFC